MRNGSGFIYFIFMIFIISVILPVLWPILLVLVIAAVIYVNYIKIKISKEIYKQQNTQVNENYDYSDWTNQANNQKDVIVVEYTEHKESEWEGQKLA